MRRVVPDCIAMKTFLKNHWQRVSALALITLPGIASAAGGGVLGDTGGFGLGGDGGNIRETIINIVQTVLGYMALLATVMIIIAGIWLIVGSADDSAKEKAKKIITYTIVGLIVIILAEAIVTFVMEAGGASS